MDISAAVGSISSTSVTISAVGSVSEVGSEVGREVGFLEVGLFVSESEEGSAVGSELGEELCGELGEELCDELGSAVGEGPSAVGALVVGSNVVGSAVGLAADVGWAVVGCGVGSHDCPLNPSDSSVQSYALNEESSAQVWNEQDGDAPVSSISL